MVKVMTPNDNVIHYSPWNVLQFGMRQHLAENLDYALPSDERIMNERFLLSKGT